MKPTNHLAALSLALVATSISPALAADVAQPSADAILKQMSDKLVSAQQFTFKATREISGAAAASKGLQAKADMEVQVKRPNGLLAKSTSKDDVRTMVADGQTFTVSDVKENMYAVAPMRASLDALPAQLAAKYGFVPPLADLVISNPYRDIKHRAQSISYGGKATYRSGFLGLNSVECHRLMLTGKVADAELWIAVSDSLPRKLTATFKAGGTLNIEFKDWNLNASIPAQAFVFTPPAGAQAIPMVTVAEAKAGKYGKR